MLYRKINQKIRSQYVMEGAGVRLKRVFGFYEKNTFDPFLLLDNFGSDDPYDYLAGFPWHPHRGIETVTYMLSGSVEHGDSMGNKGTINSGDVQWMTAGSGIIHQEMPKRFEGRMQGFQLWVNLPASHKMMPPRYQDVPASSILQTSPADGVKIKVIAGDINGVSGPVKDIVMSPRYYDIHLAAGKSFEIEVDPKHTVICFVYEGSVVFEENTDKVINAGELAQLTDGNKVWMEASDMDAKLLFISGMPLNEKVAWRGPIVMNTEEELNQAFLEYRNGTFIK